MLEDAEKRTKEILSQTINSYLLMYEVTGEENYRRLALRTLREAKNVLKLWHEETREIKVSRFELKVA